ncbi:MAG: dioxygenase [Candidatus Midichloriaceae bacterium]|jgi:protocatechuate 3,4-dioxygenase beta subunit|nr:dioxygenase [Candidatus Midichloriaceae bacterium]
MKYKITLAAMLISIPGLCCANAKLINECEITPQIWLDVTPPPIQKTNNLRRAVGASEFANGAPILLEGKVLDELCVPISNAIVEIWQADGKGNEVYKDTNENSDPNFVGTGTSITDNMGNYSFITIMPGSVSKSRAPHINIRVRHRDFQPLESIIYLENSHLNSKDSILKNEVKASKRNLLIAKAEKYSKNSMEDGVLYRLNVCIDGKNKYKKY